MACQMVWPIALPGRVRDDSKAVERLFGNVRKVVKLENIANARATHWRESSIFSQRARTYLISPISLFSQCAVRNHKNLYKNFYGVDGTDGNTKHTSRPVRNEAKTNVAATTHFFLTVVSMLRRIIASTMRRSDDSKLPQSSCPYLVATTVNYFILVDVPQPLEIEKRSYTMAVNYSTLHSVILYCTASSFAPISTRGSKQKIFTANRWEIPLRCKPLRFTSQLWSVVRRWTRQIITI